MHSEDSKIKWEFPITENYSPEVPFEVIGIKSNKKLVAVVDTGFTGFLQIPLSVGIAANMRLWGIGSGRLADGSIVKDLECVGEIKFVDEKLFNIISLSDKGEDCLLGMQFLNQLGMDFTVSPMRKKAIFFKYRIEEEKLQPKEKEESIEPATNSSENIEHQK